MKYRAMTLLALVAATGVGELAYRVASVGAGEAAAKPSDAKGPVRDSALPPVTVASVRAEDVSVTLSGIGTVVPFNTVNVRSRVDGDIIAVRFQEGQDVREGDTLAQIDPRGFQAQLDQQTAMRERDRALLAGAKLDLGRAEALVGRLSVTQQQLDQQRSTVSQYQAQLKSDDAQIDLAQTQLSYADIRAPISGRVGLRLIDRGNFVKGGDTTPIAVINQLKPISVIFTLSATRLAKTDLTLGRVVADVDVYAADNTTFLDHGSIELVDNQVDQTTGTIKIKATFPNEKLRLWPGAFVNGRLIVGKNKGALTVPDAAVRQGPQGDFVFVVDKDQIARVQSVRAEPSQDGRVVVERGLQAGERVVTEGQFGLRNGAAVDVVRDMARAPRS